MAKIRIVLNVDLNGLDLQQMREKKESVLSSERATLEQKLKDEGIDVKVESYPQFASLSIDVCDGQKILAQRVINTLYYPEKLIE